MRAVSAAIWASLSWRSSRSSLRASWKHWKGISSNGTSLVRKAASPTTVGSARHLRALGVTAVARRREGPRRAQRRRRPALGLPQTSCERPPGAPGTSTWPVAGAAHELSFRSSREVSQSKISYVLRTCSYLGAAAGDPCVRARLPAVGLH